MTSTILQSHLPGPVEVEFQSPGFKLMLLVTTSQKWLTKPEFFQLVNIPYFWQFHSCAYFLSAFHDNKQVLLKFVLELPVTPLVFWIHEWRDAVSNRKVLILGSVLAYCHLSRVGTSHCMVPVSCFSFVHQKKSTRWPQIVFSFDAQRECGSLLLFHQRTGSLNVDQFLRLSTLDL